MRLPTSKEAPTEVSCSSHSSGPLLSGPPILSPLVSGPLLYTLFFIRYFAQFTSIMRLHLFAPAFLSASVLADTLSNTLQGSGFTLFQQRLQDNPELLNSKEPNLVVYAPTDSGLSSSAGPGRVKRQVKYQNGYHFTGGESDRYPLPSSFGRRMVSRNLQSGGEARLTFLDDPAYVNLGWVSNQSLVERPAGGARQVYTGLGGNVNVAGSDIPFDNGVIRPIDGLVPLRFVHSASLTQGSTETSLCLRASPPPCLTSALTSSTNSSKSRVSSPC